MKAEQLRKMIILYHEHLDVNWARCTERTLKTHSILTRSYMDVFDWIMDEMPELCERGFHFSEGQTIFFRTFMERHPEKWKTIANLIENKGIEVLRQGEVICDSNCVPAESISRNFLIAEKFYSKYCKHSWSSKLAFMWDAFGNSANMPQILKLSGAELVGGTKYRLCEGHYWVGIDGSKLPCIDMLFGSFHHSDDPMYYLLSRHPHCPHCKGAGCEKCEDRGMINAHPFRKDELIRFLEGTLKIKDKKFVLIGGEESIPGHAILDAIEELNKKYAGEVIFRCGTIEEFWNHHHEFYESIADQYQKPTPELNPVNAGCYVTRIEKKQRLHSITYALIRAEAAIAKKHWIDGTSSPVTDDMVCAWHDITANMQHDAIGGAQTDSGCREFMSYLDEAESIAYQYANVEKPYHANRTLIDHSKDGMCHKKLGEIDVFYDLKGIISAKKNGIDVFGEYRYHHLGYTDTDSEPLHIGELVLQDDWGEEYGWMSLGQELPLGAYNYQVCENNDYIWWSGKREVSDPRAKILEWEIRVQASQNGEYLEFTTDVNWDTANKRLRVVFPVNDYESIESIWEIPYGFIKRSFDPNAKQEPLYTMEASPTSGYEYRSTCPTGEFPALHWVKHEINHHQGAALLTKGIPSVRWLPGNLSLSLLRSPQMHDITILPHVQDIWDIDGMRDTGHHRFEYAIYPYVDGLSNGDLTRTGYDYNSASPDIPFEIEGDVVITAFKTAEDGNGFILRVQEANGTGSKFKILFDGLKYVTPVNIIENPIGNTVHDCVFCTALHKHEIFSVRIR